MKRKTVLLVLLMAMFAPLAMNAQGFVKHPRLTLQAEPVKSISTQNAMPDREDGWLYYDNGTYATSIGAGGTLYWGSMFPPDLLTQYDGTMLTKVAIHTSYEGSATLNVYVGGSQPSGSPSATQTFTMVGDGDFMEISLDNPVEIDATQNLWITFYQSGVTYPADACEDTENANNRWVSIDGNSWMDLAAAGLPGYGWMIRGYVETINTDCPKPLAFAASDVMPHSATLSWRTSEEISSWEIVYSNREGFNPDQATPILVSENPYTLTGLAEGTTFYAYVRSACGSDWSSLLSFTTPTECDAPIDLEATEVTATTATLDWTGYQNSYNVRYWIPAQINFNETDFTQVGEDYVAESVLTTYTIDLSAFSGVGNVAIRHYNITDMFRLNVDDIVLTNSQGQVVASEDFETGEFNLNWVNYDNDGDGYVWDIWEITQQDNNGEDVGNGSYCATSASYNSTGALTPDNWLIIPNVELGGTLTFVARGQDPSWSDEVFGVFVSTTQLVIPASEPVVVENISNPYTLTGLTPETEYVVQVQGINADCGNLEWSVNLTFTTLPTCQVPTQLAVTDIGVNRAMATWTSDAEYFDIELNGVVIEEDYTGTTYGLVNLEPATIYSVRVRANCGNGDYSQWTEPVEFVTECGGAKDLPYSYDFENIAEYISCWEAYRWNTENSVGLAYDPNDNTNIVFRFSSYNEIESGYYDQMLISPELNATTPVSVRFDYMPYFYYPDYGIVESFLVGYSTETNDPNDFEWVDYFEATNDEDWTTYSNIFPAGTKYVAVYYISEYQYYLYLDNFRFEVPKTFVTDGDWDDANNWLPVGVPTILDNVSIEAEATIPADCVAEVNAVLIGEGGSITIEDGGRLYHSTYGLEVTMKKNVPAYTGTTDNYQLLASPFVELYTSPGDLTSAEGNDFYKFDNSQPGEEWQNNKQVEIEELYIDEGYLYANPESIELSLTGSTMPSNVYYEGYINYESVYLYYDDTENEVNGWHLLGNPFIVDAYIYEGIYDEDGYIEDLIPMNVMYYDENGDMQTIESGPIAPMQGFFVSVTEEIEALIFPFDILNAKNMPSLKNFKKRNGNNNTIPAVKLPSINADKSTQPMTVMPMSAKTKAVKSEKKAVKPMSVKK